MTPLMHLSSYNRRTKNSVMMTMMMTTDKTFDISLLRDRLHPV